MKYFSNKFQFTPEPNPLAEEWDKRIISGLECLDMTGSNPTKAGLVYEIETILSAFNDSAILEYNPDPKGRKQVREQIATYYTEKRRAIDPEDIFLTTGSSEAISFLWKLLCNPGDEFLAPSPGYPLFDFLADLENIELKKYSSHFSGETSNGASIWELDFKHLESLITSRTKGLILVQPNNPTGYIPNKEEYKKLADILIKKNLILIVDEVFSDYLWEDDAKCRELEGVNAFYLNGFSKILGLPQMKLGWIYSRGTEVFRKNVRDYLEIITDTFLSVGTPIQIAAEKLFSLKPNIQNQVRTRVQNNLQTAKELLQCPTKIQPFFPVGGWYLILQLPEGINAEDFTLNLVTEYGVYTHPGYMFELSESQIVISLLTEEGIFREGLEKIKKSV